MPAVERSSAILKLVWIVAFGAGATLVAQESADSPRQISALKVDKAPEIDGELSDAIWEKADWQGDLTQLKPALGKPAQAPARFAIVFSETHVYIAIQCANPTGVRANSRITRRDDNMDLDNAVTVYLDTFHTRRDCYYFSTNSLGTQADGRIGENGRTNDKSWDCNWQAASLESGEGWTAEMAIPVKEIRIPSTAQMVWGVNFRRNYPDLFETSFWTPRDQAWKVSQSGDLVGLTRFKKGFSASLYPYLVTLRTNLPASGLRTIYSSCQPEGGGKNRPFCTEVIGGADLLFDIGSSVNGNVTFNPDFATVEADEEVVNLTRYETFFPEKRLYFLEGAELFRTPINVFHSRRIDFIDWGAKGNGRIEKVNFSALSVRERSTPDQPASQNTVVRLQRDVFGSSNLGVLYVDRTFEGGYNRVLSADGTFFFLNDGRVTTQFVGSFPSDGEFTKAVYVRGGRYNENYDYEIRFRSIDPGFRDNVNEVGFIPDDDRLEIGGSGGYRWWLSNGTIEHIDFNAFGDVFWSHSGVLRNYNSTAFSGVTFSSKWFAGFSGNYAMELFEKPFYNYSITPEIGYNLQQWNNFSVLYQRGRSFERDFGSWVVRSRFKPKDQWSVECRFQHISFDPDPDLQSTTRLVVTTDYNFTRDLYLRIFTQFNTSNNRFYAYPLLGWRFIPPFGALYIAYTADQFDVMDVAVPAALSNTRNHTFFVKLRVPIELVK